MRRQLITVSAVLPIGFGVGVGVAAYAAAAPTPTVTRSAHVAFENCSARQIILSVTVPRRAFTPGQPVTYTVRLRNTGSTTCGDQATNGVPQARHRLTVAPCGPLTLEVRNARGINVYPGPVVFHCPDETGLQLGAHSEDQTTASWSQAAYLVSSPDTQPPQAPPGSYRITVDQAVTVPFTLTSG